VRLAGFVPFLDGFGVTLDYRPTMTEDEYGIVESEAPPWRKAAALIRSAGRVLARQADDYDLHMVYRLRTLLPVPGYESRQKPDVYDFDDAIFLGSISGANVRYRWLKREASLSMAYVRGARLVIAGNRFLADRVLPDARRVEVVPSCVDPDRQPTRRHEERDVVTVGWIGSRSTSVYVPMVLPALERVNRGGLRARLVLVGADPSIRSPWIEHRPWSLASEASELASFDVGIMPLPDNEWERGKCGYKLLQYFSAGVPAIASPVGVNRDLVGDGRGVLAASTADWVAALELLLGDAELRRSLGAAGREYVEREYSYRRWSPELAELLRSL
jgi:glycosyltransferase involved in cell wall biosynthesis